MKESEGIMIFKDTMEYLINGEINEMQYAYLTKLIYETRWGNGVDESTIEDRDVRMIWKTLKHSIRKSKDNAKQYAKAKLKKEAEISPNKPDLNPNNTEVPQEEENAPEALIQGEFDNIEDGVYNEELNDDMGKFIGYVVGFEPAVETRGAAPQISMEELQRQSIEREKRREEFANNWKAHNVQIVETEPEERELTFEMIDRCVDRFDKDIALKQVKPYLSIEENIKRLRGRLNSVLQGFSQDERDWYYGLLIESKNQ